MNMHRLGGRPGPRRRLGVRGRAVRSDERRPPARSIFNTALTGYQEILSDPSYAGQIITFTNPHIGNYGVNAADFESRRLFCRGVVVRELARRPSNRRAEGDLDTMLRRYGVPGITGIDTRRLTRLIRDTGAIPGAFGPAERHRRRRRAAAAAEPGTDGIDLVATVTTDRSRTRSAPAAGVRIVAYDYGIKRTILRHLAGARHGRGGAGHHAGRRRRGPRARRHLPVQRARATRPCVAGAADDPRRAARHAASRSSASASATSCSARRSAATTVKLPFGHHGANHPVQDLTTGAIEITSQNHNFAVATDALAGVADLTHVNLNDGVCEGLAGPRRQRLLGAAPPRGRPRPARQPLPVRPLRRADDRLPRRPDRAAVRPMSPCRSRAGHEPAGLPGAGGRGSPECRAATTSRRSSSSARDRS